MRTPPAVGGRMAALASGPERMRYDLKRATRAVRSLPRSASAVASVGTELAPTLLGRELLDVVGARLGPLVEPPPMVPAPERSARSRAARGLDGAPPHARTASGATWLEQLGGGPSARVPAALPEDRATARAAAPVIAAAALAPGGPLARRLGELLAAGPAARERPRLTPRGPLAERVRRYWVAEPSAQRAGSGGGAVAGGTRGTQRAAPRRDEPGGGRDEVGGRRVEPAGRREGIDGRRDERGSQLRERHGPPRAGPVQPMRDADVARMLGAFEAGQPLPSIAAQPPGFGDLGALAGPTAATDALQPRPGRRLDDQRPRDDGGRGRAMAPPDLAMNGQQPWWARLGDNDTRERVPRPGAAGEGPSRAAALRDLAEDVGDILREQALRHGIDVP